MIVQGKNRVSEKPRELGKKCLRAYSFQRFMTAARKRNGQRAALSAMIAQTTVEGLGNALG
jgi:hypothetical protein